jgi:hypothetical protein
MEIGREVAISYTISEDVAITGHYPVVVSLGLSAGAA